MCTAYSDDDDAIIIEVWARWWIERVAFEVSLFGELLGIRDAKWRTIHEYIIRGCEIAPVWGSVRGFHRGLVMCTRRFCQCSQFVHTATAPCSRVHQRVTNTRNKNYFQTISQPSDFTREAIITLHRSNDVPTYQSRSPGPGLGSPVQPTEREIYIHLCFCSY